MIFLDDERLPFRVMSPPGNCSHQCQQLLFINREPQVLSIQCLAEICNRSPFQHYYSPDHSRHQSPLQKTQREVGQCQHWSAAHSNFKIPKSFLSFRSPDKSILLEHVGQGPSNGSNSFTNFLQYPVSPKNLSSTSHSVVWAKTASAPPSQDLPLHHLQK